MTGRRYDAVWPLHRAIVAALYASVPVTSLLGAAHAIYSARPPQGAALMPRIVLGFTTGGQFDTLGESGAAPTVQIDTYAPGPGYDHVSPLDAAVCAALSDVSLGTLPAPAGGWPGGLALWPVSVDTEIVAEMLDPDGETMHGVLRLSCVLVSR